MRLHHIIKKENTQKSISELIYSRIIDQLYMINNNSKYTLKKEFNTFFELSTILLFIVFFAKKNHDKKIKQNLMNLFINDLDFSLRKYGIGDMSIGKYVKRYVKKTYYRFNKLDKIFEIMNFDNFKIYMSKHDILFKEDENSSFYKYLFEYIEDNIKIAKSIEIHEFLFKDPK